MYNGLSSVHIKPYINQSNFVRRKNGETGQASQGQQANESSSSYANEGKDSYHFSRQSYPNGTQTSIDYSQNTVNISQIMTDFKNTTIAIGAPKEVADEVYGYLSLIEKQSEKDQPNQKIIQTNLKNASQILDDYISDALQKPSTVVNDWVDALFLQNVEYKADPDKINPAYQVQIPESKRQQVEEQRLAEEAEINSTADLEGSVSVTQNPIEEKSPVYVPADSELKTLFLNAKKVSKNGDDQKSLDMYNKALERSLVVGDKKTESMIYYEKGQIFDKNDVLESALNNYYMASQTTDDVNIKIKSHYKMAKIYDEATQFDPAMDHYYTSIAYSGEADNQAVQSQSLSNIAYLYAQQYDIQKTALYGDLAIKMADETGNAKVKGATYSIVGDSFTILNEIPDALACYKSSVINYESTDAISKTAQNYEKAASLMSELGNTQKAKKLYEKALSYHTQKGDTKSMRAVYLAMKDLV